MTAPLPLDLRRILIGVAFTSIRHGLDHGRPLEVRSADYGEALQAQRATFVTLNRQGELRGCIGHLEPQQSLVADVAENAFAAAFRDPRFPPLELPELEGLELHISILSPAEPLTFTSEESLLQQLRPGVDGLILQDGYRRGTFLPSVWEQLPEPRDFLEHLKLKAGLPRGHWSSRLQVARYETESFAT
jgi:uncharacterized protein